MLLKLDVLSSTTIKRKKPWPTLSWLGKDVGDLYLFDSRRLSQLYLPSGKTRKKIPAIQNYLDDVQGFGISANGFFVAGALNSGKVFIWNKKSGTVKLTAVLDKIRNVQPGTRQASPRLYISDCGRKVVLLSGFRHIFLWETQNNNDLVNSTGAVGDILRGTWHQIQCGGYVLPHEKDKETAIDGVFFVDPVCGTSFSLSWVFNLGDRIHVTTLHLLWQGKSYTFQEGVSNPQIEEGLDPPFSATWQTFKHSLCNLTPAERVMKSRKAYIARISPDGQVMVLAMNQKFAAHNRVMFYSLSQTAVAVIADLKDCGAKKNVNSHSPIGKTWWIADMAWTRDSLLVLCITRRGSVAVLSKLGEPLEICTEGCSLHTGPSLFLPLHPKITFQKSANGFHSDSSESCTSEKDPLSQRFSVAVHPHLPVVLSSDGYLVTVMQLPSLASYHGIMTSFMRDITRLVPDLDVELQPGTLSRVSSVSRISILQSEMNATRGMASTELLSDAPSENNSSGSSSVVPGYGLATGDQGMSFFGLHDPELDSSPPEYTPGSLDAISRAQSLSIIALALGSACGMNWKQDVGPAMDLTVNVVIKFFQFLLRNSDRIPQSLNSARALSSSPGDLSKRRSPSPVLDSQLSKALLYFRTALEVFQWDATHRNVFSWAFHLTHGIVKEILLLRDSSVVYRVSNSMRVLRLAERLLNLSYSSSSEKVSDLPINRSAQESQVNLGADLKRIQDGVNKAAESQGTAALTGNDGSISNLDAQQRTVCQTHLTGSWLLLYKFTSDVCKKMQKRRTSLFSAQEGETRGSIETQMVELLCKIQEKLQLLDVRIPSDYTTKPDNFEDVSAYLDGSFQNLSQEGLQDSLFSRRRSSVQGGTSQEHNPEKSRRYESPYRESTESLNSPARLYTTGSPSGNVTEQDSKTLLSILYIQLQQYDLKSALDLAYSLLEPSLSCDEFQNSAHFSLLPSAPSSFQRSSHHSNSNQLMEVLLQNYPVARVADNRGIKVVQTLARFMSAYFSNLSLYVYPPYQPTELPPFHELSFDKNTNEDSEDRSQVTERIGLDRAKVAQAVRDQGVYELWSANSTVELLLVSGLILEAAWLAKNLGDWKNALLLSFASQVVTSRLSESETHQQSQRMFPRPPKEITTHAIAFSRLSPSFKQNISAAEERADSLAEEKPALHSSKGQRSIKHVVVDVGTEADDKLVKEVSRVFEAGLVANLDLVPLIFTGLVSQLKNMTSMFEWIVPEEFYLPFPPSFCPQPMNAKKETLSPLAEKEERLRSEVANIVQKIFLLLKASNCLVPCVRWYTEQLVSTSENWYNVIRTDADFPVPSSLAGYADRGFSFRDIEADKSSHVSPKKKGKRKPEAASSEEQRRTYHKPPSSIGGAQCGFRDFCAIMWLLHARDKMSKSSRKFRELRSQSTGSEEEAATIHSICWETLLWTTRLAPFSSLLGATDKIIDTLLTLLSELSPNTATAELTAQFFNNPDVVQTASGRAKLKRLMAQFRGVTVGEDNDTDRQDEPLSVFYRKKCMDWEEEMDEREKLFGKVCDQFFDIKEASGNKSADDEVEAIMHDGGGLAVGTALFETQPSYFQFLDTFFMITVSKTVMTYHSKATYPVPLLSSYNKQLLVSDTKSLSVLQQKTHNDTPARPIKGPSSLFRSQSFTDVRSSRPKPVTTTSTMGSETEIKRSSSLNDVASLGFLPGIRTLGSQLLELLPSLTWLSRWTMEGSSLPSSNFNRSAPGGTESLPVMRVNVSLPLLVNSLWCLQNVYWPWMLDTKVMVDIKVKRPKISPQKQPIRDVRERSAVSTDAATPPRPLRKVLSDSNLQRSENNSAKRNSIAGEGRGLQGDYGYQSTPDMLKRSQSDLKTSTRREKTVSSREFPAQAQKEGTELSRPPRKDFQRIRNLDRIPKSNSEPNIPNIIIHSPTTDEEKDLSGAYKKRHSLRVNGKSDFPGSPTTYHSDPELTSSVKQVVTSTPAKSKRSRKSKRKEHKQEKMTNESDQPGNKRREEDLVDWKIPERDDIAQIHRPSLAAEEKSIPTHPMIRTAPSRQGKRKKKSSREQKEPQAIDGVVTKEFDGVVTQELDGVVTKEVQPKIAVDSNEKSQSSAMTVPVSQSQMELVLVVRPGVGSDAGDTVQAGMPVLRIPTMLGNVQSSELNIPTPSGKNGQTTRAETASQTDHKGMTSSSSQMPVYSGISAGQGHMHRESDQSIDNRVDVQIVAKTASVQTESGVEPKPEGPLPLFPLLQQQQASILQNQLYYPTSNPQPTTSQYQDQNRASLPLLRFPFSDASCKLDLSKMRLLEIPKRGTDHSLLQLPESKPSTTESGIPDLSKIKLLEFQPKKELWKSTAEPKGHGTAPNNWALLHMPKNQASSNGVDLRKLKLLENPPTLREAWPLLEAPRKAETPKLIPLEKILAFEKDLREKLAPFSKRTRHWQEKENIQPNEENKLRQPQKIVEQENRRNTVSRQRRRQALEKQTRPRSSSPVFKSRLGGKLSRNKSIQGKVITVQPVKRARRVDKEPPKRQKPAKEPASKKPKSAREQSVQKPISKKDSKQQVSLSESELELSEISDQAWDVSEEEKYFRVEKSPEPFSFREHGDQGNRGVKKDKERGEKKSKPEGFGEEIPGPPSMRHMKERIGRKLHEVDQQMSAYRSGSPSWKSLFETARQGTGDERQGTKAYERRQPQRTIGVQVDEVRRSPQDDPVGFLHPGMLDRGATNISKVSSSSQTEQASAQPLPRRDLVTSGIQTDKGGVDSDHVTSHAPILPPDIFLNLQMPKPYQENQVGVDVIDRSRDLHPVDDDETVFDKPLSKRGIDKGREPGDVAPAVSKLTGVSRGRQFLSVADIDHDQWLEVQSTPITSANGIDSEKEGKGEEIVDQQVELPSEKVSSENQSYQSEEEEYNDKQENVKYTEGPDKLTVEIMDSTDDPVQRFYPSPFPAASRSSARAVSTQVLNERMKEMSERIEAMDQITQNMDREFKSSRVLLSAIQSIDEVLNPSSRASSAEVMSSRGSVGSRREKPRRWGDTAPWRRKINAAVGKPPTTMASHSEDVEDSIDVHADPVDKTEDVASEADIKDEKEDIEEKLSSGGDEQDDQEGLRQEEQGEDLIVASGESEEIASNREVDDESKLEQNFQPKEGASVEKSGVPSSTPPDETRKEKARPLSQLESLTLSQDKLKEVFQVKDATRSRRDPSPDARQHLKEWMNQKRSERKAEWRGRQEELRAQEYQPFLSPTQGSTSFKKIKLMDKERSAKRRKNEDQYKKQRIESASNLLSEMLAEPVPKPTDRKPNLRYAGSVNTRYSTSLAEKKKRTSDRYKNLPKAKSRGKRVRQDFVEKPVNKKENRVQEKQSLVDSPHPEEFSRKAQISVRSQNTSRRDFLQTSSPSVSVQENLSDLLEGSIDVKSGRLVKENLPAEDDFWRSNSPTGAEFVTIQTYRSFAKNQPKRVKAREASRRKLPLEGIGGYGFSHQPRGTDHLGRTFSRTRQTDPLLPGVRTLAEIDRLIEDIPDDGSTMDHERLEGIESLLEGDDELRELLSDVNWRADAKPQRSDFARPTRGYSGIEKDNWRSSEYQIDTPRNTEPAVPTGGRTLSEFDDDVSPWNTRESMGTSEDVAQLLAEVDEAVGNMSESSGSLRSDIDWEEVDKIMEET